MKNLALDKEEKTNPCYSYITQNLFYLLDVYYTFPLRNSNLFIICQLMLPVAHKCIILKNHHGISLS